MEVARSHNLSVAIFAQGWTYETQDNFMEAEKVVWSSLAPYLAHHGPQCLPFRTSFCQGFGEKSFFRGKVSIFRSTVGGISFPIYSDCSRNIHSIE